MEENRASGRDQFQVTIKTREEEAKEIPVEIVDANDGKYYVKYVIDRECEVDIRISYKNNKDQWQQLRGSPYQASFNPTSPANVNHLTGPAMVKNVQKKIEQMQVFMKETHAGCTTKGKDLTHVSSLIGVKDCVETIHKQNDSTQLGRSQPFGPLSILARRQSG